MKMTITEGLKELKTLSARIDKAIENLNLVGVVSEGKVGQETTQDFKKRVSAEFASINALIDRRTAIKAAIVASNATTTVDIGSDVMTVAAAIERKSAIDVKQALVDRIRVTIKNSIAETEKHNAAIAKKIDTAVNSLAGNNGKSILTDEDIKSVETLYTKSKAELFDPLDAVTLVGIMQDGVSAFADNVDVVLQISNSTTFIDV